MNQASKSQPSNQHKTINFILFFLNKDKLRYGLLVLMVVIIGITPSIDSILLKNIINVLETNNANKNLFSTLLTWTILYALWSECLNITYRLYDYSYMSLMPRVKGNIIKYFYDYIQKQSHTFFQNELAGNISDRILEAARSFEYFFNGVNDKIIRKFVSIAAALVTTYYVSKLFAIIFSLWLVVICSISLFASPLIKRLSRNLASKRSAIGGKIIDCIYNIMSIRMFNGHNCELRYLDLSIQKFIASDIRLQKIMLVIRYVLGLASSISTFGVMYYLSKLRSGDLITIGDFVLVLYLCNMISKEIWDLSEEVGEVFENYGAFEQSRLLLSPYHVQDIPLAKDLEVKGGEIIFQKVNFNYESKVLFSDLSLVIKAKEKVALIGRSGSGKTSFVNLVSRLHELNRGQIFIDRHDISKVTQESLRQAISFIPQEPTLFQRSIRENILYGKLDATDEEIFDAAKKAHIHDIIMSMPQGYETMCREKGQNLSGGQKQRIVIARAILKNAPILILDEATSNLDAITEKSIRQSLTFLMQDKTVLLIAHKLSTAVSMDRVLVFDKGQIVQDGKHEDLIKIEGPYQKLWTSHVEDLIL